MSDKNNYNDPLERFFKKKAEEYDISYREEDWLRLEKQLDVRDAQITYQRKVRWIAAAAMLTISFLGYFTIDNYLRLNELNRLLGDEISNREDVTNDSDSNRLNDQDSESIDVPANDSGTGQADESVEEYFAESGSPGIPQLQEQSSLPDFENNDRLTLTQNVRDTQKITVHRIPAQKPPSRDFLKPVHRNEAADNIAIAALHQTTDSGNLRKPLRSRFSIGLVTAPDISSINSFSGFSDPGIRVGAIINYQLTPRMFISTGLVPSVVRYSSKNGDYNNSGYDNSEPVLVNLSGECLLFDIPLSLSYLVFDHGKSGVFFTAGLSSYIMLQEEYAFDYESDTGNSTENWNEKTGTRHWFSNAGLSIGYEREIMRNVHLSAEPYVRIPVKEVGWANVRLYSFGSFFSIRYTL